MSNNEKVNKLSESKIFLYRPCKSYAGKKNFINISIITGLRVLKSGLFIFSIDDIGQTWADRAEDIGRTVFTTLEDAKISLIK